MSFLDYGAGSGTTYEALQKAKIRPLVKYLGLDIIPKNAEWCQKTFIDGTFQHNPSLHKIDQPDQSWDVVYSRHVIDHMESFERAMNEHLRVAKELVIAVFWVPLSEGEEHEIKNIDYRPSGGQLYPEEYTNSYSRKKVISYLQGLKNWQVLEMTEEVGAEVSGHDWVLVLRRIKRDKED